MATTLNQINGTIFADLLTGTSGNDLIAGGGGNDIILGNAGDDAIDGGSGDDTIFGGIGNDFILGGAGNDLISGSNGGTNNEKDILFGGTGADTFLLGGCYNKGGVNDFAWIADFKVTEGDKLRLSKGTSYRSLVVANGTDIYSNNDLIAHLDGVNLGIAVLSTQTWVQFV